MDETSIICARRYGAETLLGIVIVFNAVIFGFVLVGNFQIVSELTLWARVVIKVAVTVLMSWLVCLNGMGTASRVKPILSNRWPFRYRGEGHPESSIVMTLSVVALLLASLYCGNVAMVWAVSLLFMILLAPGLHLIATPRDQY